MQCIQKGAPETSRTSDQRFRKPLLYPLSYGGVAASPFFHIQAWLSIFIFRLKRRFILFTPALC